jgi:hypothetical protein
MPAFYAFFIAYMGLKILFYQFFLPDQANSDRFLIFFSNLQKNWSAGCPLAKMSPYDEVLKSDRTTVLLVHVRE